MVQAPSFSVWQREYAVHGIALFPLAAGNRKKPAITNWQRIGLRGSSELARKFPDASAFGFCTGPRSGVTVLDIDVPDETALRDALDRHGATPVVIRSGSGNHQCWYRHNGERRMIRPFEGKPVDVLGGGFVVAPPSRGPNANYAFLQGTLDDLGNLPIMRGFEAEHVGNTAVTPAPSGAERATQGGRNNALFRFCMRQARHCDDFDSLLDCARTCNDGFCPPLADDEVLKVARSAWDYTERGQNRFGQTGAWFSTEEANILITTDPDKFLLLAFLRANNGPESTFMVANGLGDKIHMPRKRLAATRRRLEQTDLDMVRPASRYGGPALYRWKSKGGQN
jgi:hypothetical protein